MNEKSKTCPVITFEGRDYLLHKDFLRMKQSLVVGTNSFRAYSSDELPDEFPEGENAYEYDVFYEPSSEMLNLAKHLHATRQNEELAKLEKLLVEMIDEAEPIKMIDPLGVHDRFYTQRRPFPASLLSRG